MIVWPILGAVLLAADVLLIVAIARWLWEAMRR